MQCNAFLLLCQLKQNANNKKKGRVQKNFCAAYLSNEGIDISLKFLLCFMNENVHFIIVALSIFWGQQIARPMILPIFFSILDKPAYREEG